MLFSLLQSLLFRHCDSVAAQHAVSGAHQHAVDCSLRDVEKMFLQVLVRMCFIDSSVSFGDTVLESSESFEPKSIDSSVSFGDKSSDRSVSFEENPLIAGSRLEIKLSKAVRRSKLSPLIAVSRSLLLL